MRFTIDASVHLNALNPHEEGTALSRRLIETIHRDSPEQDEPPHEVYAPTLLVVEVAVSTARILDDTDQGLQAAEAILELPHQTWIPLDQGLAMEAVELGARCRLRGADTVYGAVARRHGCRLVSLDRQQLNRLESTVTVCTPAEVLLELQSGQGLVAESDSVADEPAAGIEPSPDTEEE